MRATSRIEAHVDAARGAQAPYQLSSEQVISSLRSDSERGLPAAEVRARLAQYGKNELAAEEPVPGWRRFLAQLRDPLVILLLIATAISATLWFIEDHGGLPYEALAILAVVVVNAVMGYVQQARAEQAVAALRQMSATKAKAVRDGSLQTVLATDLVPGDVITLEEGDTVPADARLISSTALQTAEASLTGESLPVAKNIEALADIVPLGDQHNMLFSGTAITYGRGSAIVTATGMQTEMGHVGRLLAQTPEDATPLQKELRRVGKALGLIVILIAIVMIATILLVQEVRSIAALFDVLILGVAFAVAAVPEGLPAVVTAVLALGVQRMAKRRAIVRHLAAVETLGSANVIASDKTGTLTKNEMTVRALATSSGRVQLTGIGYEPEGKVLQEGRSGSLDPPLRTEVERALTIAERANNATLQEQAGRWSVLGDPTEGALLVAARKALLDSARLAARWPRIGEVPFSSTRKLMTTVHTDAEQPRLAVVFSKGAPDVLLEHCAHEWVGEESRPIDAGRRVALRRENERLARAGLRTLGVASRTVPLDAVEDGAGDTSIEQNLVFAGFIGMIDPPREEAKSAVARAKAAGIRPIMITGDHPITACAIATELGVADRDGRAVTGVEIEKTRDEELRGIVREVSVYARVNPAHKLRIVKALQRNQAIVAMTGDGVNDAPALKTADIGVAMGITGTDVSKQAADIILADDNFATIVAAVEEGRTIFANIRKFLRYLLTSNMGEVMTMFFGVLLADVLGLPLTDSGTVVLPLLATQILWVNLVTDGAPALALGVDPADTEVLQQPPRPQGERVITLRMWMRIVFGGAVMATAALLVLDSCLPGGLIEGTGDVDYAHSMTFTTVVLFSLFIVFNARSDERSAFAGLFSNPWLWGGVLLSLALQVAVVYVPFLQKAFTTTPLDGRDWLVCTAAASSALWVSELTKIGARLRRKRSVSQIKLPLRSM
jgi:Ca2+-transporting ATPase